jgi:hypothetical protein
MLSEMVRKLQPAFTLQSHFDYVIAKCMQLLSMNGSQADKERSHLPHSIKHVGSLC